MIRNAVLFAGGIVVTFTALGLGLALLIGAAGLARLAANPWRFREGFRERRSRSRRPSQEFRKFVAVARRSHEM